MNLEVVACTSVERHRTFWRHPPPPSTWICWLCHPCPLRPQSRLSDRQVGYWAYDRGTRETFWSPLEWEERVPSVPERSVVPSRPAQEVVVETYVKFKRPRNREEAAEFASKLTAAFDRIGVERGDEFLVLAPRAFAALARGMREELA